MPFDWETMLTILVDVHEPAIIKLQLQKTLHVVSNANEPMGIADYWWNNGQIQMWERKKSRELLSEIGGILDTQLLKYKAAHPDAGIGIIQEGFITPSEEGRCQLWKKTKSKGKRTRYLFTQGPVVPMDYVAYRAFIYRREMEGIPVIITEDERDTAWTLSAILYNSMKSDHVGLRRYVTTKVDKENPYITCLMKHPGIGEKTATELVGSFGSPWNIYRLPYPALAEFVGEVIANTIFQNIGRTVE
jgi:hypothetical protein